MKSYTSLLVLLNISSLPLSNAPFPWFIAGGWALDLYLGRQTREHKDIDLCIFRRDQLALQEFLSGWSLMRMEQGKGAQWQPGEKLSLPIHEIHATSKDGKEIEILLLECDHQNWIYRRDPRITRLLSQATIEVSAGVQILAPEIVLLFKSKEPGENDHADFAHIAPQLSTTQLLWLRNALNVVYDSHIWLEKLGR